MRGGCRQATSKLQPLILVSYTHHCYAAATGNCILSTTTKTAPATLCRTYRNGRSETAPGPRYSTTFDFTQV